MPLAGSAALVSGRGLATGAGVGVGSTWAAGAVGSGFGSGFFGSAFFASAFASAFSGSGLLSVVVEVPLVLVDGLPFPEPSSGVPLPCALK